MLNFISSNLSSYLNGLQKFSFEEMFRWNRILPTQHKTSELICVEILLSLPVPLDAKDKNGMTLLMWASANGHSDVVELLLSKGADPELQDNLGDTALIKATCSGQLGVMKLLLEQLVDLEKVDKCGHTALALTVYLYVSKINPTVPENHFSAIKLLIDHGANTQVTYSIEDHKYSLLNLASKNWVNDLSNLLIDNLKQTNNLNLLEDEFIFAVKQNFVHGVLSMLAINPALLDRRQDCVYQAVTNLSYDMVVALVEQATPAQRHKLFDYQDEYGHLPLLLAFRTYHLRMVSYLLNHGDDLGKILLFAKCNPHYEILLKEGPWFTMVQNYVKNVVKYQATPTLTEKCADVVYQEAKKTDTNLTDYSLPFELLELCYQSPTRQALYSCYRPSSQTRELLNSDPLELNIEQPAAKRRRI